RAGVRSLGKVDLDFVEVTKAVQDFMHRGGSCGFNPLGITNQSPLQATMLHGPIADQKVEVLSITSDARERRARSGLETEHFRRTFQMPLKGVGDCLPTRRLS